MALWSQFIWTVRDRQGIVYIPTMKYTIREKNMTGNSLIGMILGGGEGGRGRGEGGRRYTYQP